MPILVDGLSKVMVGLSQRVVAKSMPSSDGWRKAATGRSPVSFRPGPLRTRLGAIVSCRSPTSRSEHRVFAESAASANGRKTELLPSVAADASESRSRREAGSTTAPFDAREGCRTYAIRSEKPLDGS